MRANGAIVSIHRKDKTNGEGQDETNSPADTKEEAARPRLLPLLDTF
jgi:hypothetical protein